MRDALSSGCDRLMAPSWFVETNPTLQRYRAGVLDVRYSGRPALTPNGGRMVEHTRDAGATKKMSPEVLAAIPKRGLKQLCVKFMSKEGCLGRGDGVHCSRINCVHERPATINKTVGNCIISHLGGLHPGVKIDCWRLGHCDKPWPTHHNDNSQSIQRRAAVGSSNSLEVMSIQPCDGWTGSATTDGINAIEKPLDTSDSSLTDETTGDSRRQSSLKGTRSRSVPADSRVRFANCGPDRSSNSKGFADRRRARYAARPSVLRDPDQKNVEEMVDRYLTKCARQAPWHAENIKIDYSAVVGVALAAALKKAEAIRDLRLKLALLKNGIRIAAAEPMQAKKGNKMVHVLDMTKAGALSALARKQKLSLVDLIVLVRGQTHADPSPIRPWTPTATDDSSTDTSTATKNHESANRYANAVTKGIREGQDGGQYLVLLLRQWSAVTASPLSAVEKKGEDPNETVRVTHDLACPRGDSTNTDTIRDDLPAMVDKSVARLAQRIEELHRRFPGVRIVMMSGDVKGAYRHLMTAAADVYRMAAQWPQSNALIVDVSAPFGWTASPAYYGMYGGAITWLVARESPASMGGGDDTDAFFDYEWVDDHVLIEPDVGDRAYWANQALRLAVLAVLGPRAVNEKKFTFWSTELKVLGLEFDTALRTVSMPVAKIAKAHDRVCNMRKCPHTTQSALRKLLGSLRHVCTCIPAARSFFQGLQLAANVAHPVGRTKLSDQAVRDLRWFDWILAHGQLRGLPTSMFADESIPDVHLYMDASNDGLVVLNPATSQFIQLKFDSEELEWIASCAGGGPSASPFNINVREHMCIALAAILWGHHWATNGTARLTHVHCWSDNTSTVSWTDARSSRNPFGQELNRAIGLQEAVHGFRLHAQHLPGDINTMADAGSRAWKLALSVVWTKLSCAWHQTHVPPAVRKVYATFSASSRPQLRPSRPSASTKPPGISGATGPPTSSSRPPLPPTLRLTAMFGSGVDILTIKKFGRWRSDCVETYAVLHDACIAALAPKMAATVGPQ